jgi:hypothetical protein
MKIKVFELEFDASNLHEVSFVKEVISGSNLSVKTETVAVVQEREEKPAEAKKTASGSTPCMSSKPKKGKLAPVEKQLAPVEEQPAPVEEQPAPVETVTNKTEEPTAKEMQDLVIGLIRSGELSRDDVQNIFQEFGGTSLMKIAPAKFALLKQRLTTYKND